MASSHGFSLATSPTDSHDPMTAYTTYRRLWGYLACSLIILTALFASCRGKTTSARTGAATHPSSSIQDSDTVLVGKRIYLSFPGNESVIEYVSAQHLYWSSKDSVHGYKEGEDRYHALQIEPHVFFVNWAEADGTTVTQVLDLKKRTCQAFISSDVYSHKRNQRQTQVLSGLINRVESARHLLFE